MGSSLNNDNTDYGDVYTPNDKPFNMVCPQLSGKKPNAYQSACVVRLTAVKVDLCCRQCETGKEVLTRLNPGSVVAESKCSCGGKSADGGTMCKKCRDKANRYWRDRNPDRQRKCKMCKTDVESKVMYCETCRTIASENSQIKRTAAKKKKKLLYRQKKIEQQLAALK